MDSQAKLATVIMFVSTQRGRVIVGLVLLIIVIEASVMLEQNQANYPRVTTAYSLVDKIHATVDW